MRNVFLFLFSILLVSCVNDTKDNTPAFQANLNDAFWKAVDSKAQFDANGNLEITALKDNQVLKITIDDFAVGTYLFGTNNSANYATYQYSNSSPLYTTGIVSGSAYTVELLNAGSGYSDDTSAQTTATTGTGAGLVLKTFTDPSSGAITQFEIKARGINYKSGDVVTLDGGNGNATFRLINVQQSNGVVNITSVANGEITGDFFLNLSDATGDETVTFSKGIIFKLKF